MSSAPTAEQKTHQAIAGKKAVAVICGAWDEAIAAVEARGYPTASPGPKAAAGIVKDNDALHTRTMPPAHTKVATFGDSTGNAALQFDDAAERWLKEAKAVLKLMVAITPADHRVWTSAFYPPALQDALTKTLTDLIVWWPKNTHRLLERLQGLANTARREWPDTPATGQSIGEVVVGERANTAEICAGCTKVIGGNAEDPIRRVDGAPYHLLASEFPPRGSCFDRARKAKQRAGGKEAA